MKQGKGHVSAREIARVRLLPWQTKIKCAQLIQSERGR